MFSWSKHAGVVFCASLVASTASASIPDGNGVFHGCYSVLGGGVRIVDEGTSCGLFEKAVSWQQTGPVGPQGPAGESVTGVSLNVGDVNCPTGGVALTLAGSTSYVCNGLPGPEGPQGPVGPQGPPGPATEIVMDFASLHPAVPDQPNQEVQTFATNNKFTAAANGRCIVSLTGFIADDNTPPVEMYIIYHDNNQTYVRLAARAELNGSPIMQGSAVVGIYIAGGHTYEFGVEFKTYESGVAATATAQANATWLCRYDT